MSPVGRVGYVAERSFEKVPLTSEETLLCTGGGGEIGQMGVVNFFLLGMGWDGRVRTHVGVDWAWM